MVIFCFKAREAIFSLLLTSKVKTYKSIVLGVSPGVSLAALALVTYVLAIVPNSEGKLNALTK